MVDNTAFYNSKEWRRLAKAHKRANPLCVVCESEDRLSPAQVTDHILAIADGGSRLDWDNLQSLCHRCHNAKSGREAHRGRGGANL